MIRSRKNFFVAGLAVASVGAAIWAVAAPGRGSELRASALAESPTGRATPSPDTRNLAEAVERWHAESSALNREGPGKPVLERAKPLLSNVGRERDTLTAFPTTNGVVCFEIRAAGTCGKLDTPTGIAWAILSTRGSTRVFGIVADEVSRVTVNVDGTDHRALLRSNAFFYELDEGVSESAIRSIASTSKAGSTRTITIGS
jgi:hypothetical protein